MSAPRGIATPTQHDGSSHREEGPPDRQPRPSKATGTRSRVLLADIHSVREAIAYAVFVETTEGRESRRLFLSLHSASRAVARAEARGHTASMTLCALVPIGGAQ